MPADVVPIRLRVRRRDIAYVKFVIESYEGVAVTRTLDPVRGEIVVLAAPDFVADARRALAALEAEGACSVVDAAEDGTVDWLGPESDDG
jgi:hypothetical protein